MESRENDPHSSWSVIAHEKRISLKPATLGSYMYCTVAFIISSATETNAQMNEFPVQGYGGRQRQVLFAPGSQMICLSVRTNPSLPGTFNSTFKFALCVSADGVLRIKLRIK